MSMQNLNGDSYQGAQVGANVQSQVGDTDGDPPPSLAIAEPLTMQSGAKSKPRGPSTSGNNPASERGPLAAYHASPLLKTLIGYDR